MVVDDLFEKSILIIIYKSDRTAVPKIVMSLLTAKIHVQLLLAAKTQMYKKCAKQKPDHYRFCNEKVFCRLETQYLARLKITSILMSLYVLLVLMESNVNSFNVAVKIFQNMLLVVVRTQRTQQANDAMGQNMHKSRRIKLLIFEEGSYLKCYIFISKFVFPKSIYCNMLQSSWWLLFKAATKNIFKPQRL